MSGSLSYYQSYPTGGEGPGPTNHFSSHKMSHRYISRGLPEPHPSVEGASYHVQSLKSHSLMGVSFYESYDDATDHGGRKMGGDKSSQDRLTQSYHTHQTNYTRPRQPYYTYHPPVTTPSLLRTNSGHSSSSHFRNLGNSHHDDRSGSYHDERRRDLTSTVSYPQTRGTSARGRSYDWSTLSWSQSNIPKAPPSPLATPLDSPEPHSDSSPPTTINHRPVALATPLNSAHSLANRSTLHHNSSGSHGRGTPYIDIISHPEDVMIAPSVNSFELVCEARVLHSSESPVYQWFKDEEPLIGEVASSLVRSVALEEDMGFYFCIVSDSSGITQRKSRQAYVCMDDEEVPAIYTSPSPPLIIEQPPPSMTILIGARLHLKLTVQGTPEPTYRWFKNEVELPHFSGCELIVPRVTVRDEGKYMCSIRNEWGSVLSGEIDVRLLTKSQRSSSDSQLSIDDLEDHEIAFPPSYTAPSSPRKHLTTQHSSPPLFPSDCPLMEGDPKDELVTEPALKIVTGQLKSQLRRQSNSTYSIERIAFCLSVSKFELSNIRLNYVTVEDQVFQILKKWKVLTYRPTVSLLEDSLRMEGFMISVPHIESSASAIGGGGGGVSTPPVILEHPQSLYAPFNSKVSLSISAEGEELQYQWYRNNKLLPGQTTPTLTIPTITETSRGLYHCVVSGRHGNSMSRPAHLTVTPGKLNFPPQSISRVGKFRLPFSQSESAIPCYSPHKDPQFQFPRRGSADTFFHASNDSMGSSSRQFLQGNGYGVTEQFENMKLDKNTKPVIIQHPLSQEVGMGKPLQLSVLVDPPDGIKYIWYFNGLALHKETFPEFLLNCFTEEDVGDYYCEISNNCDRIKSDIAKVTLKEEEEEEEKSGEVFKC